MSQSSVIAGALVLAFVVFITVRGELPGYLGVLGIGNAVPGGTGAGNAVGRGASFNGGSGGSVSVGVGRGGGISVGVGGIHVGPISVGVNP